MISGIVSLVISFALDGIFQNNDFHLGMPVSEWPPLMWVIFIAELVLLIAGIALIVYSRILKKREKKQSAEVNAK